MLTINDADNDYAAVTSSIDHLRNVWPGSGWPNGLTLQSNLIDLSWHHKEFTNRTSFAYMEKSVGVCATALFNLKF